MATLRRPAGVSFCARSVCVSVCVCARSVCVLLLLLLVSGGVGGVSAEEYDYYSWPLDPLQTGRFYAKQPQCVDIPADLRLCYGVGYKRMRLPNLLEHETLAEVRQQAGSWVPLLAKRCHADTQVFLCSLFAPVCLDRPVYPCRSLCEAVRDACGPVMEAYGFPWPPMLQCSKFPLDNDLCIPMQHSSSHVTQTPVSKVCPPCDNELKADTILEHFCASDFVLKLKLKEVRRDRGDRKLIVAQKKKKVLKMGVLRKKDLKKLVLYVKNGANCPCPQLDSSLSSAYLVMGRRLEQQLLVMAVHKWDKKSKELKFALKYMKSHQCPSYHTVFQ
ncbi:secreted frizzled-related protein 5 [Alosa pseudoharengus]|uniref:secreted frizzled-related protein 5 n=1 Tax=Alosa pseudoharengus TaxID=34774 RepID=UPI003F8C3D5F